MNFKKCNDIHYKTERCIDKEDKNSMKEISKKYTGLLKVQNIFPIKKDLIHCSLVLYRKENTSNSKNKKRNKSLLENKSDFPYKKQNNKKSINIRININNNNKMYYKIQKKPLTSSTSSKQNLLKVIRKENINSTDRIYKRIKIDKNNSIQYKYRYANRHTDSVNINRYIDSNNSLNMIKRNKNKKREFILKKRKYGELKLGNNNFNNKIVIKTNLHKSDNSKEKSTKNKNNIIIYNNNKNGNGYSEFEKHKIDTSVSIHKTLDKIDKNKNFSLKINKMKINKSNNNISNFTKRISYIVPSIKIKRKNKEEKKDKKRNENIIYNEETKQLFMSNLIENRQIEYLKNYEKHKIDFKERIIKNNEKKLKIINDEIIINKLINSNDDYEEKINQINYKKEKNKTINYIIEQNKINKNNYTSKKNKSKEKKKIKENIKLKLKEKYEKKIDEENRNYKTLNMKENNKIYIYNLRKSKVNTLEYIHRINNNINLNRIIKSLSCLNFKNKNKNNDLKKNTKPESKSSINILYQKKNLRTKEDINDFIKSNRIKMKYKKMKLRKEKNEKIIRKFKNIAELQKKIKENEKNNLINNKLSTKQNKTNRNIIEENFIRKARDEFNISQNTSLSSSLNQNELYLSIYDTQRIYFLKENNRRLLKTRSMIFNKEHDKTKLHINKDEYSKNIKIINKNNNLINNNNINKKNIKKNNIGIKKLDQKTIKTIKNVIIKLNEFLKDNSTKKNNKKINYFKNKKYLKSNYDFILKNANKFLKQKINKNIKKSQKKNKNIKTNFLINIKPIHPNDNNFKRITINEIKKLINSSNKEKIYFKFIDKNHIIINKEKRYKFSNEQLDKYKEIFDYIFIYLKLFFQKNIFNIIITFVNLKYKYISGFNQIIFFIKKKPFNFLRIIQQREYYQVILRQFYLPYLNKAFNKIKLYSINIQNFSYLYSIIKQIYYSNFFKKLLFYIKIKENCKIEFDKIIEEEKDDISYESSSKFEYKNNNVQNKLISIKKDKNNINNYYFDNYYLNNNFNKNKKNDNEDNSSNKEISESFDEIKELFNIFNIIINNISHSPKKYLFNLLKQYYLQSKNKDKNINQNIKIVEDIDKELNKVEIKKVLNINNINNNNYQSYFNESPEGKIQINVSPNNDGNYLLPKKCNLINEQEIIDNTKELYLKNNTSNNNENINNSKNNIEITENMNYYYSEGRKKRNRKNIFSNKNNKKDYKIVVNPYKGEKKNKNINVNNHLKQNNSNSENKENNSEEINLNKKINNIKDLNISLDKEIKNIDNENKNKIPQKEINISNKKSDLMKKFKFQNNAKNIDIKYSENNYLKEKNSFENNKIYIPNENEEKLIDKLTNEIINELFKEEIINKNEILSNKINMNNTSNININELIRKDSQSKLSNSPGRKINKLNSSQNLVPNNNEIKQNINPFQNNNIQDEDGLNTSIFMKTIYEIKKENELKYYEHNILPKLLSVIENNIYKNYLCIINNLKQPLKKNDEKIMNDLSNLITIDIIKNNDIIKYKSEFMNDNIIKTEYLNKKILIDFNNELKNESIFYNKYYFEYLNQCIYDSTNEIIKKKRLYGDVGEPLLWSIRNRIIEYKYKDTNLFKNLFISNIIKELKRNYFSKIGPIIENNENININQFSKERDIKYNQDIKEELIKENDFEQFDEQETIVKLMISKMIMNQLLNEVIEILEHVQYSRNSPERYNYKSIYCCDNIPILSFQINNKNKQEEEEDEGEAEVEEEEEEEEKSEQK